MARDELPASVPPHKHVSEAAAAGDKFLLFVLASDGYPSRNHCSIAEKTDFAVIHVIFGVGFPAIFFPCHVLLLVGDSSGCISENEVFPFDPVKIFVVTVQVRAANLTL